MNLASDLSQGGAGGASLRYVTFVFAARFNDSDPVFLYLGARQWFSEGDLHGCPQPFELVSLPLNFEIKMAGVERQSSSIS
jgi:hypothetical protein